MILKFLIIFYIRNLSIYQILREILNLMKMNSVDTDLILNELIAKI